MYSLSYKYTYAHMHKHALTDMCTHAHTCVMHLVIFYFFFLSFFLSFVKKADFSLVSIYFFRPFECIRCPLSPPPHHFSYLFTSMKMKFDKIIDYFLTVRDTDDFNKIPQSYPLLP